VNCSLASKRVSIADLASHEGGVEVREVPGTERLPEETQQIGSKTAQQQSALAATVDTFEGVGNADGRVSFDEAANYGAHLKETFDAEMNNPDADVQHLQSLFGDYSDAQLLMLTVQDVAAVADENHALAERIDSDATTQDGARIGNGDGALDGTELETFRQDREARLAAAPEDDENEVLLGVAERLAGELASKGNC
jgi:hypothetical protein